MKSRLPVVRLWQAQSRLNCLTPDRFASFDLLTRTTGDWRLAQLRDRSSLLSLASVIPERIVHLLKETLDRYKQVRFLVADDLPQPWHEAPYEWLALDGITLHGRVVVERYAPLGKDVAGLAPQSKVRVFSTLPRHEFAQHFAPTTGAHHVFALPGATHIEHWLELNDFSDTGVLILIGHGTNESAAPMRQADGADWSLPVARRLPPVVILLVCGSDEGNLISYARCLLDYGSTTIVAPYGELSADGAREFLSRFLQRWREGWTIAEILIETHRELESPFGARRLVLVGDGAVSIARQQDVQRVPDRELRQAARQALDAGGPFDSITELLDRATFQSLYDIRSRSLDQAINIFRGEGNSEVVPREEQKERAFLLLAYEHRTAVCRVTQAWLVPWLAYLAQAYDHRLLDSLGTERKSLAGATHEVPAQYHLGWASTFYRFGQYSLACEEIVSGLTACGPKGERRCEHGLGLLLNLANVLIDLDLPEAAEKCLAEMRLCLAKLDGDEAKLKKYQALDPEARCALRRGTPKKAYEKFKIKRQQALSITLQNGGRLRDNDFREVAWLLYVAAWSQHSKESCRLSREAWLAAKELLSQRAGHGNQDLHYLVRALALAAWRVPDAVPSEVVDVLISFISQKLEEKGAFDSGPLALAAVFFYLAEANDDQGRAQYGTLEQALAWLYEQHYLLELAALRSLLGRTDYEDVLNNFWQLREHAVAELRNMPKWLRIPASNDWDSFVKDRRKIESAILAKVQPRDSAVLPSRLVAAGVLPL